jgi:c-di-GMP-related signal transduction protein
MSDVFVGRQPILVKDRNIFGYELLFRSSQGAGGASVVNNIRATASVMTNTLNNIGLRQLIGDKRGFVNVDVEIMESGILDLLPPENTVLELLETVSITEDTVALCKKMRQAGYSLALDDFVYDESYLPIFSVVDYVKIDVLATPRSKLPELAKVLVKHRVKLLAEKVEAREDFQYCVDLGFTHFQGYFFAKPSLVTAKSISPTQIALIELSNALSNDKEYPAIEALFRRNPELNFKLLKFINSASFYTSQKISSIRHAIALLGYRNLQKWVTLLLYSGEAEDIKASPLLERAAIRGRVNELLAQKVTKDQSFADSAFIAGVLSLIDVLFQMPIDQILGELNLSTEICSALLKREGLMGHLLSVIEKLETEDYIGIGEGLSRYNLTIEHLFDMEKIAIIEYENYEGTTE